MLTGGIALINSVGNLGGFLGPYVMGHMVPYGTTIVAPPFDKAAR